MLPKERFGADELVKLDGVGGGDELEVVTDKQ